MFHMFGKEKKCGDLIVGCTKRDRGQLTFGKNTCDVEGPGDHDPMIMQWRFTSEAGTKDPIAARKRSLLLAQSQLVNLALVRKKY